MIIVKPSIFIHSHLKNKGNYYRQAIYGCPDCRFEGKLYNHGSYERNVITEEDSYKITIYRVKCPICGKTHALIPDFLIPYFQYSFKTIKKCLDLSFTERASYKTIVNYFHSENANSYLTSANISGFLKRFISTVPRVRAFFSSCTNIYPYENSSVTAILKNIDIYNSSNNEFNLHYFQNMPTYFMSKG